MPSRSDSKAESTNTNTNAVSQIRRSTPNVRLKLREEMNFKNFDILVEQLKRFFDEKFFEGLFDGLDGSEAAAERARDLKDGGEVGFVDDPDARS